MLYTSTRNNTLRVEASEAITRGISEDGGLFVPVEIPQLSIPAYFISGQYDYNCPWELVQEYCSILQAPAKEFYLIPEAAHSPLWENPEVTCGILRNIKEMTSDE